MRALLVILLILTNAAARAQPHGGPIRALAVADGLVATAGFDGTAILWRDAGTQVLRGHQGSVTALAVAAGRVLTGGADGLVLSWHDGAPRSLPGQPAGAVAGLSAQGDRIAASLWSGVVRVWQGDVSRDMPAHDGPASAVAFLMDGRLATAGFDGTIRLWDPDLAPLATISLGAPVNALLALHDGSLAAAGADGVLRILAPDASVDSLPIEDHALTALAASPDGARLAVASLSGSVALVTRSGPAVAALLHTGERSLWAVAFAARGNEMLTGGATGVPRRWDADSLHALGQLGPSPPQDRPSLGRGAQVFRACAACHVLTAEAPARAGPSLHNLFGRRAASQPGFAYSPALRALDLDWSPAAIDRLFDIGPAAFAPGTIMPEQRIGDAADRAALVEYLKQQAR